MSERGMLNFERKNAKSKFTWTGKNATPVLKASPQSHKQSEPALPLSYMIHY